MNLCLNPDQTAVNEIPQAGRNLLLTIWGAENPKSGFKCGPILVGTLFSVAYLPTSCILVWCSGSRELCMRRLISIVKAL